MLRPRPPADLTDPALFVFGAPRFEPATDLRDWLVSSFISEGGALYNEDHSHLIAASIGVLWTNAINTRLGQRVVGQAEFKPPGGTMGKWARARAQAQIYGWFGTMPDFLLTFDAEFAAQASDRQFCAVAEHELYHCGQARDEFGLPKFTEIGMPVFAMRGHDLEEFSAVVRRYGLVSPEIKALIDAARQGPEVDTEEIEIACGTCRR